MSQVASKSTALVAMGGAGLVLCAVLVVLTEYAHTKIRPKSAAVEKAAAPAKPFAARIDALNIETASVVLLGRDEREYLGKYVHTTSPGLYLDVVSGEVLFTSLDKLETAHGHAEFSKSFDPARIVEKEEKSVDTRELRVQLRSKLANTYLGWISPGDPPGVRRYVINSSALRFVPVAELEKNSLGQYRSLFPEKPAAPAPGN